MQLTCDRLTGKRGGEQGRGEIMCGVARKIIAVVGTERMLSNMGCIANGHIWYVRCTYGYAYMYIVLPNVYLYYYICYCTTDVTTLVVAREKLWLYITVDRRE